MSLRDCLNSAVEQKAINSRQADELHSYFEARFKQKRGAMSDAEASAAAKAEVSTMLRKEAAEKKRQVLLAEGKRKELAQKLFDYRTTTGKKDLKAAALAQMIHYGEGSGGGVSMDARKHGLISLVHRDLSAVMERYKPSAIKGLRQNRAEIADLAAELNGEASGNMVARTLAGALKNVMEDLRIRFNRAGGNIPKREDFDLPHVHDARKILAMGKTPDEARAKWKAYIAPLLDPDLMTNPQTGETVGRAGLDASLDYVFDSIVSDGMAHLKPSARKLGKGSLANRYQEGRFLHFRSSREWMDYNARFGEADVVGLIFDHINKMASDIAAMETFGPNPDATIEWLKQAVQHEIGKGMAGKSDFLGVVTGKSKGNRAAFRVDALWRAMRGRPTVWDAPASFAGDIRNVATAAMLGFTSVTAALTDPTIAAMARKLAGLPLSVEMHNMLKNMVGKISREDAAKHAIIADDFLHVLRTEVRLADNFTGHNWSRFLVDRALTYNLLKPMTQARKRVEATAWHAQLGSLAQANVDWLALPKLTQRTLSAFGIDEKGWHKMRAGVDADGFLSPASVLDKTKDRGLAEAYAGMIHEWGERSVPSSDPRVKSVLVGNTERGTLLGEVADFASQFMSFGMSFTARQMEAVYLMAMQANTKSGRVLRGAGYFGAGMVVLTLGAAMAIQSRNVATGNDLEDMTDPKFWVKAMVAGGGGGLFADFFAKSENKFGGGFGSTLAGPGGAMVSDGFDLTAGTAMRAMRGEELDLGKRVSAALARYTPILSSHPATRLAYRRLIVDQLQWLTDPKADKAFKARANKSSQWWRSGELMPNRAPGYAPNRTE